MKHFSTFYEKDFCNWFISRSHAKMKHFSTFYEKYFKLQIFFRAALIDLSASANVYQQNKALKHENSFNLDILCVPSKTILEIGNYISMLLDLYCVTIFQFTY